MWTHEVTWRAREAFPGDVDVVVVPPPDALRPMSLGYREALADLLWIRALIFSGERLGHGDLAAVQRYVDGVTGLAPRFLRVYTWGGVMMIYGGEKTIRRDMVDAAIAIHRRGLEQFPESHELLFPLGMLLLHQVPSTPGYSEAERERSRREGAELVRRAAAFGADPLVRQYAATLVAEHATDALARQFLESQLATVEDADYRRLLRKKLAEIGGEASVEHVESIRRAFQAEHAAAFPYATDTIYAVIRDERTPPSPP